MTKGSSETDYNDDLLIVVIGDYIKRSKFDFPEAENAVGYTFHRV